VSIFSIVATLLSWHLTATQVQRKNEVRFNALIDSEIENLSNRVAAIGHALDACEGLIRASQSVERHE
jgi:CHASE1-domain containing sensor protein